MGTWVKFYITEILVDIFDESINLSSHVKHQVLLLLFSIGLVPSFISHEGGSIKIMVIF